MTMKLVAGLGLAAVVSQNAFAANPDFLITHRVATFTQSSEKTGDADAVETTSIAWADPTGMEFAMFHEGWAVYAYPFNPDATIWIGKNLGGVEVGPTFRFSLENVKDGSEMSSFGIGAYVFYGMDLGVVGLETNLNPYFASGSESMKAGSLIENDDGTKTPLTADVKVDATGFGVYWDLMFTKKVADNFTWAGGFEVTYDSTTAKPDTEGAKDVETTTTNIGVVLTEFRYGF